MRTKMRLLLVLALVFGAAGSALATHNASDPVVVAGPDRAHDSV